MSAPINRSTTSVAAERLLALGRGEDEDVESPGFDISTTSRHGRNRPQGPRPRRDAGILVHGVERTTSAPRRR
jgi:hypothetical protein